MYSNNVKKDETPRCIQVFEQSVNSPVTRKSYRGRLDAFMEFGKQYCKYYVFRWMPEHYPERSFVEQAWYHEFRTDLTEETKQKLRDTGNWPD